VRPPHHTGCAAARLHRAARGGTPLHCARAGAKGCAEQAVVAENKRRGLTAPSKCSHDAMVVSQAKAWRRPALSRSRLRRPLLAARGGAGGCTARGHGGPTAPRRTGWYTRPRSIGWCQGCTEQAIAAEKKRKGSTVLVFNL
jgi:hypothetical protein